MREGAEFARRTKAQIFLAKAHGNNIWGRTLNGGAMIASLIAGVFFVMSTPDTQPLVLRDDQRQSIEQNVKQSFGLESFELVARPTKYDLLLFYVVPKQPSMLRVAYVVLRDGDIISQADPKGFDRIVTKVLAKSTDAALLAELATLFGRFESAVGEVLKFEPAEATGHLKRGLAPVLHNGVLSFYSYDANARAVFDVTVKLSPLSCAAVRLNARAAQPHKTPSFN